MPKPAPITSECAQPTPRRTPTARLVLLGAVGSGLLGLALPAAHANEAVGVALSASEASALTEADVRPPHPVALTAPQAWVLPRRTVRASRSRPARPVVHAPLWVRPVAAGINSFFGERWGRMHKGVDFAAAYGDPIHAIGDGVVVGAGYLPEEDGYGQITLIRHANGIVSAYAHQSRVLVTAGQHVTAGQVIGYVGDTGHVTGPHLHFEIRTETHGGQIDPTPWLREHGIAV